MYLRPTKREMQDGGFWGTLASTGIPLAMNLLPKLFGKRLQVDKIRSRRSLPVYVPKKGISLLNYDVLGFHQFMDYGKINLDMKI